MMRRLLILLSCLAPVFLGASVWKKDFEEVALEAKEKGKHILVYFTGSDWSGWSMKMKKEILENDAFLSKVNDDFLLVEIDFPEHKTLSAEEAQRNQLLKTKWNIHDYPRLIVLDENSKEISRFVYCEKSPEAFANDLCTLVQKERLFTQSMNQIETIKDLSDLYKRAQELKREKDAKLIIDEGVKREELVFLLEKYRNMVEEGQGSNPIALDLRQKIVTLDPQNEKGMQFSLALIDFQGLANQTTRIPTDVTKPLEEYLAKFGEKDVVNKWRLEMVLAQVYLNFDEWKTALKHAEVAYANAPDNMKEEVGHSLNYIRQEAQIALK